MRFSVNTELNKTRILFLVSLILTITAVVLFLLSTRLVSKKLIEFQELDTKLSETQEEYTKLIRVLYKMPAEKDLESIKFIYLPLDKSIEFIDEIEKIFAHRLDVTVGSLQSNEINNSNVVLINMPIIAKGKLKDILAFVKVLENLPYLSKVNAINLEYADNNNWQLLASVQIYSLKPKDK